MLIIWLQTINFLYIVKVYYLASIPEQKINSKHTLHFSFCHFVHDPAINLPTGQNCFQNVTCSYFIHFCDCIHYMFSPDRPVFPFHFSLFHDFFMWITITLFFLPTVTYLLLISYQFCASFQNWVRVAFNPKLPSFLKEHLGLSDH